MRGSKTLQMCLRKGTADQENNIFNSPAETKVDDGERSMSAHCGYGSQQKISLINLPSA